VGVPVVFVSHG